MTHTPLVEVTQACLIRSVILDRLVSVTIIPNLFVPDSIFLKSQLIEIMHGKGISITVSIIFNTFCSFPSGLYPLTLEKHTKNVLDQCHLVEYFGNTLQSWYNQLVHWVRFHNPHNSPGLTTRKHAWFTSTRGVHQGMLVQAGSWTKFFEREE